LRLFVAEIGAEVLHEFDDAVLAQVFVGWVFESVVGGHRSVVLL
jgi:hypothetical protein